MFTKKLKNTSTKAVCILLSLLIVLSIAPLYIFAEMEGNAAMGYYADQDKYDGEPTEATDDATKGYNAEPDGDAEPEPDADEAHFISGGENFNESPMDSDLYFPNHPPIIDFTHPPESNMGRVQSYSSSSDDVRFTVLVLDASGATNLTLPDGTFRIDTAFSHVRTAAQRFVRQIESAEGTNYVAVVMYRGNNASISPFTRDMDRLHTFIGTTNPFLNTRNVSLGFRAAEQLLDQVTNPNAIKNVVLFTTGMTNAGEASLTGRYSESTIGSHWFWTDSGNRLFAYANVAFDASERVKQKANVYVIGLFQNMANVPAAGHSLAQFFRLSARDWASSPAFFFDVEDPSGLYFVFGEVADKIGRRITGHFYYSSPRGSIHDELDFSARFFWDEDYFANPASQHSDSLATMTLSFALSAFGSDVGGTHTYTDKSRNVRDLLHTIGFENVETNHYFTQKPGMDSIGVVAGHRDIRVNGRDYTLIAISTRGGGYEAEWASNFTIGRQGYHDGFETAARETLRFLQYYISKHQHDLQEDVKLWMTGFSRGAAAMNLVASWLSVDPMRSGVFVNRENIYAYLFATPQNTVSDRNLARDNFPNIHNTVLLADPVPYVAPRGWGFTRYGQTIEFPERAHLSEGALSAYREMMYFFQEHMGSWTANYASQIAGGDWVHDSDLFVAWQGSLTPSHWFMSHDWEVPPSVFIEEALIGALANAMGNRGMYTDLLQPFARLIAAGVFGNGLLTGQWRLALDLFGERVAADWLWLMNPFVNTPALLTMYLLESFEDAGVDIFAYFEAANISSVTAVYMVGVLAMALFDLGIPNLRTAIEQMPNLFTAHYPELYLAWLMQRDPHFNADGAWDFSFVPVMRVIRIASPVDVHAYDLQTGNLAAQIINGEHQNVSHLSSYVSTTGEKVLYLPAGGSYRVEMPATGSGVVSITIGELDRSIGGYARITNWFDVPVTEGDVLTLLVPAFSAADANNTGQGSSVVYNLARGQTTVTPDMELRGETAEQALYHVTVESSSDYTGFVTGQGRFMQGAFAQVAAIPAEGILFLGWYAGNVRVSTEDVYRFRVMEDIHLVGRFSESGQPAPPPGGGNNSGSNNNGNSDGDSSSSADAVNHPGGGSSTLVTGAAGGAAPAAETPTDETYAVFYTEPPTGSDAPTVPPALPIPAPVTPRPWVNPFIDVAATDWFYTSVGMVHTHGLMNGTSARTFSPYLSMTRAMFVMALANMEGVDLSMYGESGFSDVAAGRWYTAAIEWASSTGLVQGVGSNRFDPSAAITREQMAVLFHRYVEHRGIELRMDSARTPFVDEGSIGLWAVESAYAMQGAGIITGRPGYVFDPKADATRAEVATLFARFVQVFLP